MKTMCKETKIKKVISLINSGKTWEECSELLENSVAYLQKIVREYYKTPTRYNNLLRKARENKKANEQLSISNTEASKVEDVEVVEKVETAEESFEVFDKFGEDEEVILVETGYLLEVGISVFTQNVLPIFISSFCVNELDKMAKDNEKAKEIIMAIMSTNAVQQINLRGYEYVYIKRPSFEYKPRSKGIAAAAKYLAECYPHVRVLTNSYEVVKILEEQDCENINVILNKVPVAS